MNQQGQWQARAVRPRYTSVSWCRLCLVYGLRYLLILLNPAEASALSMLRAVPGLSRASLQRASVQLVAWLVLISIPEC